MGHRSECKGGHGRWGWCLMLRPANREGVSEPQGLGSPDVTSHHTSATARSWMVALAGAAEEAALETVGARGGSAAAAFEVVGAKGTGRRPRGSSKRTSAVIPSQGLV